MTDISNWPYLIRREMIPADADTRLDEPRRVRADLGPPTGYILLPFSEYQMGNLLGVLKRSVEMKNGDWFDEIVHLIVAAMDQLHIEHLGSNFGDVFTLDALASGEWLER